MHLVRLHLRNLRRDERGLSSVEYVVMLVLVVAMAAAAWNSFGTSLYGKLTQAAGSFDSAVAGGAVGAAGLSASPGTGSNGGPVTANLSAKPDAGGPRPKPADAADPAHTPLGGTGLSVTE